MPDFLTFDKAYEYDTRLVGITVTAKLAFGENFVEVRSKIDTGASFCIFKRIYAENLGIEVESGTLESFSTVTGSFLAYGHELTLSVLDVTTVSVVYFAADENFTRNVLGRQGRLDRVKLGLIDYEGKLFLSPYNEVFG